MNEELENVIEGIVMLVFLFISAEYGLIAFNLLGIIWLLISFGFMLNLLFVNYKQQKHLVVKEDIKGIKQKIVISLFMAMFIFTLSAIFFL